MEHEGLHRELLHCRQPFPCFIRGCHREAVNLARLTKGQIVVQVCLCDECLAKSAETILRGLRAEPEKFANGISPPHPA